jgi:hypothetical protein
MSVQPPKESELLAPVVAMFDLSGYVTVLEAKLSRKRIDLLFVPNSDCHWIAVELKVSSWKRALWQASLNSQLAEFSYVALWEGSVASALTHQELFKSYGVGIISVGVDSASIVLHPAYCPNSTRPRQQADILQKIAGSKKDGHIGPLSLLSA